MPSSGIIYPCGRDLTIVFQTASSTSRAESSGSLKIEARAVADSLAGVNVGRLAEIVRL
ncbi:hypothetical protein [Paenibacillus gorillae]|uniref:hypothetical protein n=1 Tax=Paenibacillus gorillae TaxID=1243662 RepID=UPI0012DD1021|nr:hypothetical protein [Paenibacillus gorillae]